MERVMSDARIPSWLTDALARPRPASAVARPGDPQAGDVCRLTVPADGDAPSDGRLVLVLDVDADAGVASVMLTHADHDIRTSLDVLIAGEELGLPFDLAMQTDLVGPIGSQSLAGSAIGHVGEQLLDALRDAVDLGEMPDDLLDRVGMPLRGERDARWAWKAAEGEALDRMLAAHAPVLVQTVSPIQMLADAFRAIGSCGDRQDDMGTVTDCLLAFMARREAPPAPVLSLLAQLPIAAALGNDMMRAIGPLLRVA